MSFDTYVLDKIIRSKDDRLEQELLCPPHRQNSNILDNPNGSPD